MTCFCLASLCGPNKLTPVGSNDLVASLFLLESAARLSVVVLWEVIFNLLRIGNRSFWGSGRHRGPGRPFRWVGGFAPYLVAPLFVLDRSREFYQ